MGADRQELDRTRGCGQGSRERGNQDTIPKLLPLLSDDRSLVEYIAAASIVRLSGKQVAQR